VGGRKRGWVKKFLRRRVWGGGWWCWTTLLDKTSPGAKKVKKLEKVKKG